MPGHRGGQAEPPSEAPRAVHGERADHPHVHVGHVEAPAKPVAARSGGANGLTGRSHGSRIAIRCTGTPSTTSTTPCRSPCVPGVAVKTSTWCPRLAQLRGEVVDLHLDAAQPRQVTVRQQGDLHRPEHVMRQDGDHMGPAHCVAFHAHPDDEALLDLGHDGARRRRGAPGRRRRRHRRRRSGWPPSDYVGDGRHGARLGPDGRAAASAAPLGVARVENLGYADSGLGPEPLPRPARARCASSAPTPEEAAARLAAILREEQADVLLTYDANGGYGHRDHVKVHHVGARAAELAGTPTRAPGDGAARPPGPGDPVRHPDLPVPTGVRRHLVRAGLQRPRRDHPPDDVRRYASQKRASMRAHASQASADGGADRTLAAFLRIPRPVFDLVFGREWYVDASRPAGAGVAHDVFG